MGIKDMHIYFRQYAQQMGMQNVRAILPEQIDILINTSITDTINQIIRENVAVTNDRVITDNSKIGQINSLRTLYKVAEVSMLSGPGTNHKHVRIFDLDPKNIRTGKLTTNNSEYNQYREALLKSEDERTESDNALIGYYEYFDLPKNVMFYVDFALNYIKGVYPIRTTVNSESVIDPIEPDENGELTNYFPVRLIDDAYLADVLNDFILKPSLRSPILVVYNNYIFDLYIDQFTKVGSHTVSDVTINDYALNKNGTLSENLIPYNFRISYIAKPATVVYNQDLNGKDVDCDLPEYLHVDIVKHAVDLYRAAVSGSLYAAQQQEQAAQRENTRNNYRNEQ